MGKVTEKGTILQFWFMTLVSGLKAKSTSTKEPNYKQVKTQGRSHLLLLLTTSQDKSVERDGGERPSEKLPEKK